MNILLCSAGRRCELINDIRRSMEPGSKIVATDLSAYAPALSFADRSYLVPRIDAPEYIDRILEICRIEQIHVVTTLIDPEILLLAENRQKFEGWGSWCLPRTPTRQTSASTNIRCSDISGRTASGPR